MPTTRVTSQRASIFQEGRFSRSVSLQVDRVGIALAALMLASLAILACSSGESAAVPAATEIPASTAKTGEEIFTTTCVSCHQAGGVGQPDWHIPNEVGVLPAPPLNGDGHTWHHSDGFLYRYVKNGGKMLETPSLPDFKSGMPAFGEQLSHEEIVAVLTYVKSLWGDKTSRGTSIAEWQAMGSVEDPFPPAP